MFNSKLIFVGVKSCFDMNIRRSLILFVAVLASCAISFESSAQVSFGHPELFNQDWKFCLSDVSDAKNVDFDDADWQSVSIPHDWSVSLPLSQDKYSCTGWLPGGIGWYRKTFDLQKGKGRRYYLYFEGVYNRSTVYLNGKPLGGRPNGYISYMYEITDALSVDGKNTVAVRVDHSREADSRWYTGSGIYRNVWLVSAPEVHLAQWGLSYGLHSLENGKAVVDVVSEIDAGKMSGRRNDLEVRLALYDSGARCVTETYIKPAGNIAKTTLEVPDPVLWSLENPELYDLKAELFNKGKMIDSASVRAGIRQSVFDKDKGYFLNGKNMKLKGVCLHHDAGVLGAAVPEEVWRRRLENLKSIGVNAVRTSHNPQSPVFYDLCDEIGLLVMDEAFDEWRFPKRKWLEGWNVGVPGFEGSYDFFDEWGERDILDMVRRDRNHPSIIMWSIGNEVDYPNDPYSHPVLDGSSISQPMYGGYHKDSPNAEDLGEIAKKLVAAVKSADTSRPVTAALAGVVMSNETDYPFALDIAGYNYTEDRYDADHSKYPDRVIYGSENRADLEAWKSVLDRDFISGQFIWTGTDYLGESGKWPSRGFHTGLLDFGSFVKPAGRFMASLWCEHPVAFIGTYPSAGWISYSASDTWNYEPGQRVRVVCYTNMPGAVLTLNGKQTGGYKVKDEKTGVVCWDIDYEPGELIVEAFDVDGKVAASDSVQTYGEPVALKVYFDDPKTASVSDLKIRHIVVEVVDKEGRRVKNSMAPVTCVVDGTATLLGLESCNNSDMSEQYDNVHEAFEGRILAYISTGGSASSVTFTSAGLETAVLDF